MDLPSAVPSSGLAKDGGEEKKGVGNPEHKVLQSLIVRRAGQAVKRMSGLMHMHF